MQVLLTNDDGLESTSLIALRQRLSDDHDVWVVAPDRERSGCSHSVTLREAIEVRERESRSYACTGTPADCVLLALLGMLDIRFEMVVAGPNLGPNLGTDIVYSGTAAAARQAVFMGIPGVAASLVGRQDDRSIRYACEFIARNLSTFKELSSTDHFVNLNFPDMSRNRPSAGITHPTQRIYKDRLEREIAPDGTLVCTISGPPPESHMEKGSDFDAVAAGTISISPVLIHPMNHRIEERYRAAELWAG
jgi:5'-nucleotidase